jgi:hypothetical protein
LEPQEIIDFDRYMQQQLARAYRWDLWAVAYIVRSGCSDDSFEYFRGWLIAQGKDYFEAAMDNAENAAEKIQVGGEVECESILYAAFKAYERRTGKSLPASDVITPKDPIGQEWEEDNVELLYPKLARKFS